MRNDLSIKVPNCRCINTDNNIPNHALGHILALCQDNGHNWVIPACRILGENEVFSIGGPVDLSMGSINLSMSVWIGF